jgi:putative glutamine amidotransferase
MGKKWPIIGITSGYDYDKNMLYVNNGYYEGIIKAGGMPIALPFSENEELLLHMISTCDGFLISGGPDIDAGYYGENNQVFNGEISPCRDLLEVYVINKAMETNKPLLGICRGIQVMNVARGGTIYQDIYAQIKVRDLIKHSQSAPKWYPTHSVLIEDNSKLKGILRNEIIEVNSFHHQAVKDLAPGFIATASSPDGVIEGIEHTGHRFAVGVQWHPELMWKRSNEALRLFEEFVRQSSQAL